MHKPHLFILTGASRGMGLAMAQQLLRPGHALVCISRHSNADLQEAALASGVALEQWQHDLGSANAAAAERLQAWLEAHSAIALAGGAGSAAPSPLASPFASATLINNAGLIPPIAPLSASDPAALAQALRVGLEAPMLLCAAFLAATEGWAVPRKVLNISSGLGRRAMASQAPYCAAKAGMDHFTRCLALEEALKPHGAKVCSLAPGVIDTDMQTQLRSAHPAAFPDAPQFASLKTAGMLTTPADAATRVLAWLERSDFGTHPVADVREP